MIKPFFNWLQTFEPLYKVEKQRLKLLQSQQCPPELLPLFAAPYPDGKTDLQQLRYLAIDFETTGFNPMIDRILSVAAVPIDQLTLKLAESHHEFVAEQDVKQDTAVINHIVPQMLHNAEALDAVMSRLFALMQDRIVIAHGSTIEKRFLNHYLAMKYKLRSFPLLWLDTLKIERSFLSSQQHNNYQLAAVRQRYALPEYITHNALIDAIAAGELFLAQIIRLFGSQDKTLGEIYKRSL
ncbi:DNA polymerase-3 subunit epsilon [Pasteurella testudinis DSM 23072]|uniref:DNA polymerase-3 subunit epsilon n=1 Tax=Pasteurella testudinis DSM 23072 TaxID=1122938 RepID=A0A1W1UTN6_9PAST|nr:3'-5' exonuclease [Pasteurella testudinis]SMB84467.1 DNA polymerase-3 subunit epsilon [Pasteurella testudinis DSM 23072]SUB50416.1 DNA polymerase III polC-type [Pasteurella testudinis]